jgi:hypothetical protein
MFLLILYLIIYNYFKFDHLNFIVDYFETNDGNNQTIGHEDQSKKTNFLFNNVFFNKINQLYNIFYQNLFKSAEAT